MKSSTQRFLVCLLACLAFTLGRSQVYIPAYGAIVNQCSQSGILDDLTEFQNLGVKYRSTTAQANTLTWLENKYLSYGYTPSQLVEDTYTYSGSTCKNLIVTKIGTLYPNTFLIIDGHYDTLTGPGTNDNGSGTSVILEIARLLQNVPTQYSIKFINFSGEEDGLRGSQHYVTSVVNGTTPKMDIRLVFNLDEVGGVAGLTNNTITCERDTGSPISNNAASNTMTNELINCVELYSPLNTYLSYAYASDYMSFEDNNEVITGFFETNESTHPHTTTDLLVNMDPTYVYNVAKAAIGAALHFSVACTTCSLGTNTSNDLEANVYPNPAAHVLYIDKGDLQAYNYSLSNVLGEVVASKSVKNPQQTESIDVDNLQSGMYLLSIESSGKKMTKKIMIN